MEIRKTVPFSLRLKTNLILITIFLAIGLVGLIISKSILLDAALKTEEKLVNENISRVRNIFNEEVRRLKITSSDWGHWDDTYFFSLGKESDYVERNLMDETFFDNKWSYFFIFNPKFKLFFGKGYDLETNKIMPMPQASINNYFYPGSYFFSGEPIQKQVGGLILINNKLHFVASSKILHSDKTGPIAGYLVLTREFTRENLASFSKNLELPLRISYFTDSQKLSIRSELLKEKQLVNIQPNSITIKLLIHDVKNKPIAIISFKMLRTIYKNSVTAIYFFLGLLALTGLVSLSALGLLINFTIIKRVRSFNSQITKIAEESDYKKRVDIASNDELTSMATKVNFLLDVIQTSQQKLQNRMEIINKVNQELEKLELEKRNIIEYTPEPIIITNGKGVIKLINHAVKKTFSCQIEEIQGQSIDTIFSLKAINIKGEVEKTPLSEQMGTRLGEEYLITYKEQSIPIELKTSLLDNHSKIYILRDISERKKHEKELALLNQKLMMIAREAGMSDVSRMLLHNIGNILNSVLVTLSLMQDELKNSRLNYLEQISDLFKQHIDNIGDFLTHDEKGKKIPKYMVLLGEYWGIDSENYLVQLKSMNDSVDKIIAVIRNFQFHHAATVIEKIDITELLESVLDIHINRLKKHGIRLLKHYALVPLIEQDRFKIWHILNNLITNAIDSVNAAEPKNPTVDLYVEKTKTGVRLKITDNGIGIAEDLLVSIFLFRHTSKLDGNGIGLHSSSILAKEIGASLKAYSEGEGKGATFTLDIPHEIPEQND
ncbi:Two-component sensor histidine kinase [Legionella gratiana]|uniref:histidine kinase n=1 Tax=Legionella gratiana TaxID=45066 RepID=A0A378JEA3_9GAMM|nr:CHASE4 domain-containing protein [Legionella gratiana]KTD06547.1 Two-component sensor histidine kinase [Legionella gratiana]STX45368.1 Two-component sensor histidine kinase [Legionella gratiana]